jgi:hypothetical protein
MNSRIFTQLFGHDGAQGFLGQLGAAIDLAHPGSPRGTESSRIRVMTQGSWAFRSRRITIQAISPTDRAVLAYLDELGDVIRSGSSDDVRSRLKQDNRCSIALWASTGDIGFLLGGDVLAAPRIFGWAAILADDEEGTLSDASLVKVPHHGARSGYMPEMWYRLTGEHPWALVAPFWASRIPRRADLRTLCRHTDRLYQAAPSTKPKGTNRVTGPPTGRITLRRSLTDADWHIHELIPPAWTHDCASPDATAPR